MAREIQLKSEILTKCDMRTIQKFRELLKQDFDRFWTARFICPELLNKISSGGWYGHLFKYF